MSALDRVELDGIEEEDYELKQFGLDENVFGGLRTYAYLVSGATLLAATELIHKRALRAINWNGGRHHAKKSSSLNSSALAYYFPNPGSKREAFVSSMVLSFLKIEYIDINRPDIVLGILLLRTRFPKVMYVDLDAHHGDGVEEAFIGSNSVLTISLHVLAKGFYPGAFTR